jgi:hypothetical protein
MTSNVVPIHGLRTTAKAIAARYGDEGAIVISVGKEGVRIGVEGLTPEQIQTALCTAIHYNFCFSESSGGLT